MDLSFFRHIDHEWFFETWAMFLTAWAPALVVLGCASLAAAFAGRRGVPGALAVGVLCVAIAASVGLDAAFRTVLTVPADAPWWLVPLGLSALRRMALALALAAVAFGVPHAGGAADALDDEPIRPS